MAEKKKLIWIEMLRILACFSVVAVHTASQHFRDIPVDTYAWKVSNVFHGWPRFAVPCFIMISGYLYLSSKKEISIKNLYKKNIIPMVVLYFFWQMFYAVYRVITEGGPAVGSGDFFKRILIYTGKTYFHLWYLPMFIGLLVVLPFLKVIVTGEGGKKREEYLLLAHLVFQILPVTIGYLPLPEQEYIKELLNVFHPEIVTGYIGYFVLGHYIGVYEISKKTEKWIHISGFSLITLGVIMSHYVSIETGVATQAFYENYTIAVFISSMSVFLFFKNHASKWKVSERAERMICHLGKCTFGIYLVHAFFRNIFYLYGFDSLMINTLAAIPLVAVTIFACSYAAVVLIKKIPYLGNWIV